MKKIKLIISLFLILIISQAHTLAAPRIPVYKVGNVLYFVDKASGTITGFAGEPTDITIPTALGGVNIVSVGVRAFAGSSTLSSVVIPDGITTISDEAFASCPNLTTIDISSTVSYIGGKAFANCTNLSYVNLKGIPSHIDSTAFDNTNWVINDSAEFVMLGNSTLLRYNGVSETVNIPYGVKTIAPKAFDSNKMIREVILPETVEKINDNAFVHCENLENIIIPTTVSHIGAGAFDDTLWMNNQEGDFVVVNGILISYKGNDLHIKLPEGITAVGSGAFMANESLRSIYISDSVIYIDNMAFAGCSELRLVSIPGNVEWIDEYAFTNCDKMTIHGDFLSYAQNFAAHMSIPYSTPVFVRYNGEIVDFDNAAPIIKSSRTYVPLRAVMEMMGYTVSWEQATGNVTCIKDTDTVIITPEGDITVNGVISELKAVPINFKGSNVVPVRFISEAVNASVEWNDEQRTVEITY